MRRKAIMTVLAASLFSWTGATAQEGEGPDPLVEKLARLAESMGQAWKKSLHDMVAMKKKQEGIEESLRALRRDQELVPSDHPRWLEMEKRVGELELAGKALEQARRALEESGSRLQELVRDLQKYLEKARLLAMIARREKGGQLRDVEQARRKLWQEASERLRPFLEGAGKERRYRPEQRAELQERIRQFLRQQWEKRVRKPAEKGLHGLEQVIREAEQARQRAMGNLKRLESIWRESEVGEGFQQAQRWLQEGKVRLTKMLGELRGHLDKVRHMAWRVREARQIGAEEKLAEVQKELQVLLVESRRMVHRQALDLKALEEKIHGLLGSRKGDPEGEGADEEYERDRRRLHQARERIDKLRRLAREAEESGEEELAAHIREKVKHLGRELGREKIELVQGLKLRKLHRVAEELRRAAAAAEGKGEREEALRVRARAEEAEDRARALEFQFRLGALKREMGDQGRELDRAREQGDRNRVEELEARLQELRREYARVQDAARIHRKEAGRAESPGKEGEGRPVPHLEELKARIEHHVQELRAAREKGDLDRVGELERRIAELEQDYRGRVAGMEEAKARERALRQEVEQLRQEMERLREQVERLRRRREELERRR